VSDPAIQIENLGKRYRYGGVAALNTSLRADVTDWIKGLFGGNRRTSPAVPAHHESFHEIHERHLAADPNYFWALKDINLEIRPGDVVGIIGRNGAGKSTLLKILSRITTPTTGRVVYRGRIASLLEVGTGFHRELTGRENIFLNGSILGMTRREIARKFDEIVAFAEVEKFIDTPVKHYSSGMYVRLAFAVAAHLEPEILLVDEVLAVGDAAFQKKCLGKMGDVAKQGRTVLFVSHHMPAINRLCKRVVLLDDGKIKIDGPASAVTSAYLQSDHGTSAERSWQSPSSAPGDNVARLRSVRVISDNKVTDSVDIRKPVAIEFEYWNLKPGARLLSAIAAFNDEGVLLFCNGDLSDAKWSQPRDVGVYRSRCEIPGNLFSEGVVRILVEVSTREPIYQLNVHEADAVAFQVVDHGEPGSVRAGWGRPIPGLMRPMCRWATEVIM
jgi:lipopolysaccharide transport system ATP-binding protein